MLLQSMEALVSSKLKTHCGPFLQIFYFSIEEESNPTQLVASNPSDNIHEAEGGVKDSSSSPQQVADQSSDQLNTICASVSQGVNTSSCLNVDNQVGLKHR